MHFTHELSRSAAGLFHPFHLADRDSTWSRRLRSLIRVGLGGLGLGLALLPDVNAGVTLRVDSPGAVETFDPSQGRVITVAPGAPLTFTWTVTDDLQNPLRTWGDYYSFIFAGSPPQRALTPLSTQFGSEKVHASGSGLQHFSVRATDATGGTVESPLAYVNVDGMAAPIPYVPLQWTPSLGVYTFVSANEPPGYLDFYIIPDMAIGVPYSAVLSASGNGPITYSAAGLPAGLSLNGNVVSGIPTVAALKPTGTANAVFWIKATDADGFITLHQARTSNPVGYPRVEIPMTSPVVADSGPPVLTTSPTSFYPGNWRIASGFVLKAATVVTGIRVWGGYSFNGKPDGADAFVVRFYESGPSPIYGGLWPAFPAVGRLLGSFIPTSVARSKTGRAALGFDSAEYVFNLSFAGIPLAANQRYFVSVSNANNRGDWRWFESTLVDTTYTGTPPNGQYAILPNSNNVLPLPVKTQTYPLWIGESSDGGATWTAGSQSFEMAFQLTDGPVVTAPPPTTSVAYRLDARTNGKGTITISPAAKSYAPGTVVTLTATPDASATWKGWTGEVTSPNRTITVTMNKDVTVTANFR